MRRSFRFRAGPGDGKSEVRASDVEQGAKPFLGGVQGAIVAGMPGDGKSEVRASDVIHGAKPFLGGVQGGIVAETESLIALLGL